MVKDLRRDGAVSPAATDFFEDQSVKWVHDTSVKILDLDARLAFTLLWSIMTFGHQVKRASRASHLDLSLLGGFQLLKDT